MEVAGEEGLWLLHENLPDRIEVITQLTLQFGEHAVALGSCVEVLTVREILNHDQAQQAIREHGRADVQLGIVRDVPWLRYLGTVPRE
ncbi:hypothetical protein [Kitasatospora sp. GP82]|uniref:hypothetical protein n=1 Tax=Kitasatospora sp. GP82 TaxID=3035089 RepID=UPI00247518D0|nr:hypothetical protein [Kitasatospora sp. GP82]MDH6128796.1 hypothetical protein [Kitasatospora sp. GP82]